MKQYLDLVSNILENGAEKTDRTGVGTLAVFGHQMRFDLGDGFPCVTTKKLHMRSIIRELLWFLRGDTNVAYLQKNNVSIWDEWADENGDLGPVYGKQWRAWEAADGNQIDQIQRVIDLIRFDPDSRRMLVSAWNVGELDLMALTPCHCLFQFFVANGRLSCQLYQRSCDVGLGVPFNVASYSLLTMMIAQVCELKPGEFVWTGGDAHIYLNHVDALRVQLTREPRELPRMAIAARGQDISHFRYGRFQASSVRPPSAHIDGNCRLSSSSETTVAVQGELGSFSELAAFEFFSPDVPIIPCETFADLFEAVGNGRAAYGMAPVENSLAGSIDPVWDLLVSRRPFVAGELYLRIEHCLIGHPGNGARRRAPHLLPPAGVSPVSGVRSGSCWCC